MLSQIMIAFINSIVATIVAGFKKIQGAKFYFISILIALITHAVIYKDAIEISVKGRLFSATDFREARNPYALQTAMDDLAKKDTNIVSYSVFLYEPKNQSFYKKLVLTNSDVDKNSPSLQMRYLKDQPSINAALDANGYYLIDDIELRKPDLRILKDLGVVSALYYRLTSDGTAVGEINLRFKQKPTALELDTLLKTLSPYLYTYII